MLREEQVDRGERIVRAALFLDRDGVIIEDAGYSCDPSRIVFIEETVEVLPEASGSGYLLIVVTNQSGIARGLFTLEQYRRFERVLGERLEDRGVTIDATYCCPYHPEGTIVEYTRDSECRKPRPGMILQAAKDFGVSIERSYMIGDKDSDVIDLPGLRTLLIQGSYPIHGTVPTFRGFRAAWRHILSSSGEELQRSDE